MKRNCSKGFRRIASLVLAASLLLHIIGCGSSGVWTPPPPAELADLTISSGTLSPGFSPSDTFYIVNSVAATTMTVTPTAVDPGATITVNGIAVASGATSSAIDLGVGTNTILVIVTATDGVTQEGYTLLVPQGGQQAYLKASNTNAGDFFNSYGSMAIDGDTVVVGAYSEDSNATGVDGGGQADNNASNSGAAYVFTRTGGIWSQQAYLKASNTEADDRFGRSVAVDGDSIIVGANSEGSNATGVNSGGQADNSANVSGAAYVFTRSGVVWSQQAYLKASNTGIDDQFGLTVAIDGDTVVVGARYEGSNATGVDGEDNDLTLYSGAAYIFTRSGVVWSQQAYLKASNTGFTDNFGSSVAVDGDTVVVGARTEDSSATGVDGDQASSGAIDSGAAYIFTRIGGVWSQQAYLKASNTDAGDEFGLSVAVDGDTVVVGASREDSNATGVDGDQTDNSATWSGAVYVFR